jgi:predicted HAD superfamily Cof-like phosphohydrolase
MSQPNQTDGLSGNVFEDMAAFDRKYEFTEVRMTPQFLAFRMRFLVEELFEAIEAAEYGDAESFVDAMIDLIVVAAGTLSIGKVDGQRAWNEVRRANMSKVRQANPTRPGSGGADLVKPDGWLKPDHTGNTGEIADAVGYEFNDHFSHSVTALFQCIAMQFKKNEDYDSAESGIKRMDYFIHGINDLEYEMHKKELRFRSVLARVRAGKEPNFESLRDTLQDKINYESFGISMIDGRLEGQEPLSLFDIFNQPVPLPPEHEEEVKALKSALVRE